MSMDLGPQNPKDRPFTARMRRHQSWYRAAILQVPYGVGPRPTNKTYLGNMLAAPDGLERGLNFLTPHIFAVARRRAAEKKGLLDPFRLFCNMLSNQALALNLFGLLIDDRELATEFTRALLPGDVRGVLQVALEYTPHPPAEYLNDLTSFAVWIEYSRPDHSRAFLGIEPGLSDAPPQPGRLTPAYRALAERAGAPWNPVDLPRLVDPGMFALWRGHLLAEAILRHPKARYSTGSYAVVTHPQDGETAAAVSAYRALLRPDASGAAFREFPLDGLLDAWQPLAASETHRRWLAGLRQRYLDLALSDGETSQLMGR